MNNNAWPLMKETVTPIDKFRMIKFIATSSRLTNGEKVKKFEREWNTWLGSKNSLYVSSGSTANFLLVAAVKEKFNLKDGDKVLVPACTWMTNVAPIFQLGLRPIFCDINLENFSFCEENLLHIKKEHPDIKLIFVTHLLGFSADNEKYKEIFPEALIIDDICESHGCTDNNGIKRGANSLGATFSFYYGHHMSTVEGGMISTNDDELYDLMKMKRSHGLARESTKFEEYASKYPDLNKQFLFITDGYNFRNHEICAVLGSSQLKRLNSMIDKRKKNYSLFASLINSMQQKFFPVVENNTNSSFCFPIVCKNNDTFSSLKQQLEKNKIESRPIVSGNLLSHPFLSEYKICSNKQINNVEIIQQNGIYIGNNHFVGEKEIKVLEQILKNCKG